MVGDNWTNLQQAYDGLRVKRTEDATYPALYLRSSVLGAQVIAEMDQVIQEIRQSIRQIAAQRSKDGHDCGVPDEALVKRFYALGTEVDASKLIQTG